MCVCVCARNNTRRFVNVCAVATTEPTTEQHIIIFVARARVRSRPANRASLHERRRAEKWKPYGCLMVAQARNATQNIQTRTESTISTTTTTTNQVPCVCVCVCVCGGGPEWVL